MFEINVNIYVVISLGGCICSTLDNANSVQVNKFPRQSGRNKISASFYTVNYAACNYKFDSVPG